MAETVTIRIDGETEHALEVLMRQGGGRSAVIRHAVIEAALRQERAVEMRRAVLEISLGEPDGVDVAAELSREREGER
ncbi:hypothetical protein [Kribbella hippodromi]